MQRRSVRASGQAQDATHLAVARSKSWGPQRDLKLAAAADGMGISWGYEGDMMGMMMVNKAGGEVEKHEKRFCFLGWKVRKKDLSALLSCLKNESCVCKFSSDISPATSGDPAINRKTR